MKNKNNGLSLIELLVSVAISSIVILMVMSIIVNSYNNYNINNNKANAQNEINQAMNRVGDCIMEAKALTMESESSVKTSIIDEGEFVDSVGKTIEYDSDNEVLYITHQTSLPTNKSPYMVASDVKSFSISIDSECFNIADDGTFIGYKNPIKVNVSMTIDKRHRRVSYTQSYYIRDKLTTVTVEGNTYTVE